MHVCPLSPPLLFVGRSEQLDIANHGFGFQAPLQRTETGPRKSGKVTQLLQRPGRPSGTSPCRRRDLPPPPRQSFPGALCSQWEWGRRAERCGPVSDGPGGLRKFRWDFTPGSQERKTGVQGGTESVPDLRVSSSQLAATLAALTLDTQPPPRRGKTTCSRGSQTLASAQAAPPGCPRTVTSEPSAMRSTGFKTALIPQPAWVPRPNPRGLSARKELSPVLGRALAGGLGLRERGYCGLAKPLRQVFLLFFARRRARVVSRSGWDGWAAPNS